MTTPSAPNHFQPAEPDIDRLPYPLAVATRRLWRELAAGDAVRSMLRVRDCVECGVRYLAAVLLADAGPSSHDVLPSLVSPGTGEWLDGVIRPLALRARSAPARQAAASVSNTDGFRRPLQEFVAFRNAAFFGHGPLPDADDELRNALGRWLPLVRQVLGAVAALADWPLHALAGGGPVGRWMGPDPPASPDGEQFALLGPDGLPLLDLHPFVFRNGGTGVPLLYDRLGPGGATALALDYGAGGRVETRELAEALREWYGPEAVRAAVRAGYRSRPVLTWFEHVFERNADLIPRDRLVGSITELLEGRERGLFLVEGPPGAGKTGLVVALIRRLAREGGLSPVFYFYSRADGRTDPDACVRHLYWSLWEAHGRPEKFGDLPPDPARALDRLKSLIGAHVQKVLAGRRQVILVDALDEADGDGAAVLRCLRRELPRGVSIIATSRPPVGGGPVTHRWDGIVSLAHPDTVNDRRADARRLAERELPFDLVDPASRYCDGNFLIVTLLCRHYRVAGRDALVGLLDRRPVGGPAPAAEAFEFFWHTALDRAPTGLRGPVRLAAAVLARARAPVTDQMACSLVRLDLPTWEEVRGYLRQFLTHATVVSGETEYPAYRLFHEAFAEFLRDHLTGEAPDARTRLAAYCRETWNRAGPEGEYALRHAVCHACDAALDPGPDCHAPLRKLLGDPGYFEARVGAGQVFALAVDLDRAACAASADADGLGRWVGLLTRALRERIHFVAENEGTLLTCLWLYGWWYDHPSAQDHLEPQPGGWGDGLRPWELRPRLCDRLDVWRTLRAAGHPSRYWVRSLRPPPAPLDPVSWGTLEGHTTDVNVLAYSPDGSRLFTGTWDDALFREWNAESGQPGEETDDLSPHGIAFPEGGRVYLAGTVESDGRWLAVCQVWPLECVFVAPVQLHPSGAPPAISADGGRVAGVGADRVLRVWDVSTKEELFTPRVEGADGRDDRPDVRCLALSTDGRRLAAGSSRGVTVWDLDGEADHSRHAVECIASLVFSPGGDRLLCGMGDGSVHLIDLTGHPSRVLCEAGPTAWAVAFAPAGDRAASGHEDGSVRVYDLTAGSTVWSIRYERAAYSLAFHPDGMRLAAGVLGHTVRVWELARPARVVGRPCNHAGTIHRIEFSPDGREVHTYSVLRQGAGSLARQLGYDETHRTWDGASGRLIRCDVLTPDRQAELFRRWDDEQPDRGVIRGVKLRHPVVPPPPPRPSRWRAEIRSDRTVIYQDGVEVAAYPVPLHPLTQHPTAPVWAGADGSALHLIALEPQSFLVTPKEAAGA